MGKVTGEALFPGDINLPNQAYMKVLFANRPHAIVRAIDTSAAEALPGVLAVFTAQGCAGERVRADHERPAGAVRARIEQALCRAGALCGRPGGVGDRGKRGDRGQGARFDPGGL